jgi:DNA-binding CsgD family transcriptional regulator
MKSPKLFPPIDIPSPAGLTAYRCDVDGEEFVILEWPTVQGLDRAGLTRAESEVLDLVLEGRSNAEIGSARGRSPRTVANQVAALFQKLGVRSRLELYARAAGERSQ